MSRKSNLRLRLTGLAVVTILLTGCAQVSSECPPIQQYDRATLDRAIEELSLLPDNSAIEELLKDYNVTREQLRACRG